jgi:hypothetical protein
MNITFPETPSWTFDIEELSSNAYRVVCTHRSGQTITFTDGNYESALDRARQEALQADAASAQHRRT